MTVKVSYFFSRQNLETSDISHAFLPQTVAKLSTLKSSPFLAHPVHYLRPAVRIPRTSYASRLNAGNSGGV